MAENTADKRYKVLSVSLQVIGLTLNVKSSVPINLVLSLSRGSQKRQVKGVLEAGKGVFEAADCTYTAVVQVGLEQNEMLKGSLNLDTAKGKRKAGEFVIHIGTRTGEYQESLKLENCPDKSASLIVKGCVNLVAELSEAEYR